MEAFFTPEIMMSLLTLTFMEIVLGIDNLVFLSIVSGKLSKEQQPKAQRLGLFLALLFRILLLLCVSWLVGLDKHGLFTLPILNIEITIRDLILFAGGIFLLAKATGEIHHKLEGASENGTASGAATFGKVIFQIIMLDMVFSVDSILTAVGLVEHVSIMIIAVVIAMIVMLVFVNVISEFINRHPSIKILALAFLMLIGFMLIAEGLHQHVPKGYIYFAIFFSLGVEMLNLRVSKSAKPVVLHQKIREEE